MTTDTGAGEQQGLFTTQPADGFPRPERIALDEASWVDYAYEWIPKHGELYETLKSMVSWETEKREMYERVVDVPRVLGSLEPQAWPEPVRQAQRWLETRYARSFPSVGFAWYRDGRDSVAMHNDRIGRERHRTVIAIIAIGARRRFRIEQAQGTRRMELSFGGGDLLVMGGACQRNWRHGIPKERGAGARMSIQMREGQARARGRKWRQGYGGADEQCQRKTSRVE